MLMWENKQKLISNQAAMAYKDGKLVINGEEYKSQIQLPTVRKILTLTAVERDVLNKINLAPSEVFEEKGSKFFGYAINVTTAKDLQVVYTYPKKKHADKTHIVVAYRFKDQSYPYAVDCQDDKDHGAGRCLLKLLARPNYTDKAVFVVKQFGGIKLSGKRYKMFEKAANAALDESLLMKERLKENPQAKSSATFNQALLGISDTALISFQFSVPTSNPLRFEPPPFAPRTPKTGSYRLQFSNQAPRRPKPKKQENSHT